MRWHFLYVFFAFANTDRIDEAINAITWREVLVMNKSRLCSAVLSTALLFSGCAGGTSVYAEEDTDTIEMVASANEDNKEDENKEEVSEAKAKAEALIRAADAYTNAIPILKEKGLKDAYIEYLQTIADGLNDVIAEKGLSESLGNDAKVEEMLTAVEAALAEKGITVDWAVLEDTVALLENASNLTDEDMASLNESFAALLGESGEEAVQENGQETQKADLGVNTGVEDHKLLMSGLAVGAIAGVIAFGIRKKKEKQ